MWSGKDGGGAGRPNPDPGAGGRFPSFGCPCARIVPMKLSPTKRKDIPFLNLSAIALLKTSDPSLAVVRAPIGETCLSNLMENCGITLTEDGLEQSRNCVSRPDSPFSKTPFGRGSEPSGWRIFNKSPHSGGVMRPVDKLLIALVLTGSLTLPAFGATITGTVKGPDGKPFMGAFVVAENTQNKMTVTVLSDSQGRYHINNLPAANYSVQITAVGYKGDPYSGVQLTADQKASFDFALQTGVVRWSDLTTYQGTQLLPKT